MRFYPTADVDHYMEIPSSWSLYSRQPHKTWKRNRLQSKHSIAYWSDLEGAKMSIIKKNDLYFKDWPEGRIRSEACLPWYYCVGNRFIRLEKAFPVGFKCSMLPMSLKEVQELDAYEKETAKLEREKGKEAKRLAEEKLKLEMKKKGIRM
ncbi:uncharacterized protein ACRADG_010511 [Cochliomyia hominivorax]